MSPSPHRRNGRGTASEAAGSLLRQEDLLHRTRALELLTRLGFAARGLLYIVVGLLVIGAGRAEDPAGVLAYLADGVGQWLVVAMATGFGAYGLWRLADAAFAIDCRGDGNEGLKRLGSAISGLAHLYLANQSFDLLEGARSAGGAAGEQAQAVLRLPAGQLLLGAVALGLVITGIVQLVIAGKCTFLRKLDSGARETWVKWLGRAGYAARGAVFVLVGYFVGRAALSERPSRAGGMEQALEWLSSPVDMIVAGGLLLFGIYGLIEAWYRRLNMPDPVAAGRRMANQVTG